MNNQQVDLSNYFDVSMLRITGCVEPHRISADKKEKIRIIVKNNIGLSFLKDMLLDNYTHILCSNQRPILISSGPSYLDLELTDGQTQTYFNFILA